MNMEGGASSNLPPGFHFYPSDEELVAHFLAGKAALLPAHPDIIPVVHLHRHDPWELVGKALQAGNQWYFFNRISTQSRASPNGYWSPTGVDKPITSAGRDVGVKKTLAFYVDGDRPLKGIKTNWVMHEYHLLDHSLSNSSSSSSSNNNSSRRSIKKRGHQRILESNKWVICRVYESTACGSPASSFGDIVDGDRTELSCLDEVFLSLDDLEEVSLPYR
ncbi:NAC domain-containing protein 104-like isoform X2 [Typha angustifolia]|uniref:NAC domain-containing protein 104-like isoform X2 n=1 Tax=Typha angustifolia TaxID=59011 RepID=UPI003C2ED82A